MSETLTLTIQGLSPEGVGYGYHQQQKYFVQHTLPGDIVEVTPMKVTSKYTLANLQHLVQASVYRQPIACKFFPQCGGCSLCHCQDDYYYQNKLAWLQQNLSYAHIDFNPEKLYLHKYGAGQRRRICLQCQKGQLGLYNSHSQDVVAINHCINVTPKINDIIQNLTSLAVKFTNVTAIELTEFTNGISVNLFVCQPPATSLVEQLRSLDEIIAIGYTLADNSLHICYQQQPLLLDLQGIAMEVPMSCFVQAVAMAQTTMIDIVTHALEGYTQVADLYSGIGTYGLPLAKHGINTVCYEGETHMVQALQRYLDKYAITTAKAYQRNLWQSPLAINELQRFQAVVLDPPRCGATPQVKQFLYSGLQKIVYISCNINSFVKDVTILRQQYQLLELHCLDQFYHTKHQEVVAILVKK